MNNISMDHLLSQLRETATFAEGRKPVDDASDSNPSFTHALTNAIDKVNDMQQQAGELSNAFLSGDKSVDLTQVMVAGQKANISFQAMLQVRNKLVSAYQEIMNMQI